jgi:transcriptional regulator with XRE-family HTH domain
VERERQCSGHPNFKSTDDLRVGVNDLLTRFGNDPNMPRKAPNPAAPPSNDWFLKDWMKTLRVSQAKLAKLCDWSPAKMNDIYHGRTSYYRQILNEVATALHLQPWELLMHPADAMVVRQMTRALRGVEVSKDFAAIADEDDGLAAAAVR